MNNFEEVRNEQYEALKRGERGAVENYLGFVVHTAIREALDDPVVRQLLSRDEEKENDTPPWMGSDEKLAADDLLRLACAGYAFFCNFPKAMTRRENAAPKVDMENIIRTVRQQPSKLGALLLAKLERIHGHFPETVPDEVAYRIDDGSTTEQDIWKLSWALVSAVCEGEGTPSRKRAVIPPWMNPSETVAADDVMDLAIAGYTFNGERIIKIKEGHPVPEVDINNLLRVAEERPSKLAALLYDKIERLSGFYPGGTLGRLPGKRVDSICQGIKEGTTTKQDINALTLALIGAIMESME